MKPVPFNSHGLGNDIVIAKDQPQYKPIPANIQHTVPECPVTMCWELSDEELNRLLVTKKLWHSVWTFGQPLQPILLSVTPPEGFSE